MKTMTALAAAFALLAPAAAHMSLAYPPPFRAAVNPNVPESAVDFTPTAPLSGASQFPCKGYQVDLGTKQGKSVADWNAGTQYNFTVLGSAVHGGGSCQAALSYDKGVTWKVIHTYLGSCPLTAGESFDFTVPSDAPATDTNGTIFAWLWYNVIGNREIYMSCASVTVNSGGSGTRSAPAVAYSSRPDLFVANLANGCTTVEGKEVQIPIPGPAADTTTKYSIGDNSGSFTGTCQAVDGIGGESGSSSDTPAASGGSSTASPIASSVLSSTASSVSPSLLSIIPVPAATSVPGSESSASGVFATSSVSSPAESAAPSAASTPVESSVPSSASSAPVSSGTSSSSGLAVSADGSCGSGVAICETGMCCSSYGFCGNADSYCGTGCQAGFGTCGAFLNSTSSIGSAAPTGAKFRIRV